MRFHSAAAAIAVCAALFGMSAAQAQTSGCANPNPNLSGPPFVSNCPLPAAALNRLAPLNSPGLTGSPAAPSLALGTNGSITGKVFLENGNVSGATVTLQSLSATSAYNYNLPATAGAAGQPLLSGGGGTTSNNWGTLAAGGGGSGDTSPTAHAVLVGEGSAPFGSIGPGTAGQVLQSGGGADPSYANIASLLSGGTGISITGTTTAGIALSSPNLTGTTGSIGGSSIAAGACTTGTATVTGATTAMPAIAGPATFPGAGYWWKAYVSSAGTASVEVCNATGSSGTPTASTYNIRVIQ